MTTLHLVNHPQTESDALATCLAVAQAGDGLLLLENGVYAAIDDALAGRAEAVTVLALEADVRARGLTERVTADCRLVDYAGFVHACTTHDRVVTWT